MPIRESILKHILLVLDQFSLWIENIITTTYEQSRFSDKKPAMPYPGEGNQDVDDSDYPNPEMDGHDLLFWRRGGVVIS